MASCLHYGRIKNICIWEMINGFDESKGYLYNFFLHNAFNARFNVCLYLPFTSIYTLPLYLPGCSFSVLFPVPSMFLLLLQLSLLLQVLGFFSRSSPSRAELKLMNL